MPGATVLVMDPLDRQSEGIDVMNTARTLAVDHDVYEIAYLAGGSHRAVDTAVVALVERGHVSVNRSTGHLSVADGRPRHWLEEAVLDGIGDRGYRTVQTLRWRMKDDERFADVRRRLQSDGLLRRSVSRSHRYRPWRIAALTGAGRRALRHLRSETSVGRVAGSTDVLGMALGGPAALSDLSLRAVLFDPPPPPPLPSERQFRRDPYLVGYETSTTSAAAVGFWVVASESGGGWAGDGGAGGGDGGGGGG